MDAHATEEEQATDRHHAYGWRSTVRRERKHKRDIVSILDPLEEKRNDTHKKGIHLKFSNNAPKKLRCPRRYSSSVYPKFPIPGNTTVHAKRISKLWR